MTAVMKKLPLTPLVEEFEKKMDGIDQAIADFDQALSNLEFAATVQGCFGERIHGGYVTAPSKRQLQRNLRISAWRHFYQESHVKEVMPAADRTRFERHIDDVPDFDHENVLSIFGKYMGDPRYHVLRGLAEQFTRLDDAYKSHSKVRIGVKGLPKRIVMNGIWGEWGFLKGEDRVRDLVNALRLYQNKPAIDYSDMVWNLKSCPEDDQWRKKPKDDEEGVPRTRLDTLTFKQFKNGNLHIHFDANDLRDINMALAEFYGEVLPDVDADEEKASKPTGTAVAKDLQFYPSPVDVIQRLVSEASLYARPGEEVRMLEPQCGDGRILTYVRQHYKHVRTYGIEIHKGRADYARSLGHKVMRANFLEFEPTQSFEYVVMNPPFYGTHWAKHIEHATKFLTDRGTLASVLPATAWYDHKDKLPEGGRWIDLPHASFRESGTNIPTGIFVWHKR